MTPGALVLATVLATAGVGQPSPLTPMEERLVKDARDGALQELSLLQAGLLASGVSEKDLPRMVEEVEKALAGPIARARTWRRPEDRGKVLLRALHETVLWHYETGASDLDDAVLTGEFNCLSSAVLYAVAAEGLLDEPRAMFTRYHAFARFRIGERWVDVETTTPNGFDLDRPKELMTPDYVRKIAGPGVTPEEMLADLQHPEALSPVAFVAGLYMNRAIQLMDEGRAQEAIDAIDRGARIATGRIGKRIARWRSSVLNNGAVELTEAGRLTEAVTLLKLALKGAPRDARVILEANLASVYVRLGHRQREEGQWAAAVDWFARARDLGARRATFANGEAEARAALAALEGGTAGCRSTQPDARVRRDEDVRCLAGLARNLVEKAPSQALASARRAYHQAEDDAELRDLASESLFHSLLAVSDQARAAGDCERVTVLVMTADSLRFPERDKTWRSGTEIAGCWVTVAEKKLAVPKPDWAEARNLYAEALRADPTMTVAQTNVRVATFNLMLSLSEAGRCETARPIGQRAVADTWLKRTEFVSFMEGCALTRAEKAFMAKDFRTAISELRRGLRDAPESENIRINLGNSVNNLAITHLQAGHCGEARALVPELVTFGRARLAADIRTHCP